MATPDRSGDASSRAASHIVRRVPRGWIEVALVGMLVFPTALAAQQDGDPPARTIRALSIREGQVNLDGRLAEPVWQLAQVATGFIQQNPDDGAPATERTEFRVLYTGSAVYVGVRAFDSEPDQISSRLHRRDVETARSDAIGVFFDSYHDRLSCFKFKVSPNGSIEDEYASNDRPSGDLSWDPVWQVKTTIDSLGWTAEFRIPFTQLRYDREGTTWGVQVLRWIERKAEGAYWAPMSKEGSGYASRFGVLEGMENLPSPMRLEVLPYTVASNRQRPEGTGSTYAPSSLTQANAGFDLKYGLTSDFTLDVTVSPDFGQVEADPVVVNLTAFETRFQERRPFFVEGSGLFRRWVESGQLFYSRRIGRRPLGSASAPEGGTVEIPEASTIISAAKVTGKSAGGMGLGIMSALTTAESATLRDSTGVVVGSERVQPLAHHFAARVEQDFRQGSHTLGGMVTALNRQVGDEFGLLRSAAYVAEVDGRHRWHQNTYGIYWQLAASHIRGSEEAMVAAQRSPFRYFQRPDADHVEVDSTRTALSGYAFYLETAKLTGTWRYDADYYRVSPGFDFNDLGFQRRADVHAVEVGLDYVRSRPQWTFRNFLLRVKVEQYWTTAGESQQTYFRPLLFAAQFKNNWALELMPVAFNWNGFSPTQLRGGPGLRCNAWHSSYGYVRTDARRSVSATLGVEAGGVFGAPERRAGMESEVSTRLSGSLTTSLGIGYEWLRDPAQWIGRRVIDDSTRYILGTIEQQTLNLTARVDLILSPNLSLQLYAQPYVSAGRYFDFKEVVAPQAGRFEDRYRLYGDELACVEGSCEVDSDADGAPDFSFGQPDFNYKSLRSTMVLRWEYRPGSVLFVAWQHRRSEELSDPSFRALSDLGDLFSLESDSTFLVKASYWLGF